MSKEHKHHTLATVALIAGMAASTMIPGTATAQSKLGANGSDSAFHQVVTNGPEADPNMPNLPYPIPGAPITWSLQEGTPEVNFVRPSTKGAYLGFNDKGSWIRNEDDRRVYVWNIKTGLSVGAENDSQVPFDLRNPSNVLKSLIARVTGHGSTGIQVANNNAGRRTPYIPPSVAGDGNAQYASGGARSGLSGPTTNSTSPIGSANQLKGSGATVKAGVLTFKLIDPTSPENGQQMSYNVARSDNPGMMMNNPNAPKPTGINGTWIADDPHNKDGIILFMIKDEDSVVGSVQSGIVAQAMKRLMLVSPKKP